MILVGLGLNHNLLYNWLEIFNPIPYILPIFFRITHRINVNLYNFEPLRQGTPDQFDCSIMGNCVQIDRVKLLHFLGEVGGGEFLHFVEKYFLIDFVDEIKEKFSILLLELLTIFKS